MNAEISTLFDGLLKKVSEFANPENYWEETSESLWASNGNYVNIHSCTNMTPEDGKEVLDLILSLKGKL